ncbi:MAG: type II toxin-antitoxin system prevent-host-death family antitoxin [Alphaproteobacteria bacterium]|nr:type II toxin-antitoxin system prevent-host-death family antitoxin [Alphaproteobacteria bacterium]
MPVYGAFEARNKLSELLDRASRGEEVLISRRGKIEAMIVPASAAGRDASEEAHVKAAIERFRALRQKLKESGVSWTVDEIIAARNEGRR